MIKTFKLAIRRAALGHPAVERLIAYVAQFPLMPIQAFIFLECIPRLDREFAVAVRNDGFNDALAELRKFALISVENTKSPVRHLDPEKAIRLHPLIRQTVKASSTLPAEFLRRVAAYTVADLFERDWNPATDKFLTFRLILTFPEENPPETEPLIDLVLVASRFLHPSLRRQLQSTAIKNLTKMYEANSLALADWMVRFGKAYGRQDELQEARTLFQKAASIYKLEFGEINAQTIHAVFRLAGTIRDSDKQEAAKLYGRVICLCSLAGQDGYSIDYVNATSDSYHALVELRCSY